MTNNKFKMSQKNGVQPQEEEIDYLVGLMESAKNKDMEGMIYNLCAIEDDKFEIIKDKFGELVDKTFSSREFQNNLNNQIATMTVFDYEEELKGYEEVDKFIAELEISDDKKAFLKKLIDLSYSAVLKYKTDPSEHIEVIYQKLNDNATIPTYAHVGDAGADLYLSEDIVVGAQETKLAHTGIAIKVPKGYEAQVRPRSGMSLKTKIRVANAPGTIDSNYRGEVCIIIDNNDTKAYFGKIGDRIAQLVFNKVPIADFVEGEVTTEEDNDRGKKGFGSTEKNEQVSD